MWTVVIGFAGLLLALLAICWIAIRAADEVDRIEAEQRWGTTLQTDPEEDRSPANAEQVRRDREQHGYEP